MIKDGILVYPAFCSNFSLEVNMMKMLDYVKASPQKVKENINDKESLVTPLVKLFVIKIL